jgi:hypothetical protein
MNAEFVIHDLFRLASGTTVLACDGVNSGDLQLGGRKAELLLNGRHHQTIVLLGERQLLKQSSPGGQRAIETTDDVRLSAEDARSGLWRLSIAI